MQNSLGNNIKSWNKFGGMSNSKFIEVIRLRQPEAERKESAFNGRNKTLIRIFTTRCYRTQTISWIKQKFSLLLFSRRRNEKFNFIAHYSKYFWALWFLGGWSCLLSEFMSTPYFSGRFCAEYSLFEKLRMLTSNT